MPNPMNLLLAPPVLQDADDPAYYAARDVLEHHPVTAGMDPMALSSLAQQLVDATNRDLLSKDEIVEQCGEALGAFRELARRKTLPQYVHAASPQWVDDALAEEGLTLDRSKPAATPAPVTTAPAPQADAA
ncbi:hypothetical protein [Parafrankia sp. FMc2]|uniref:hypothetical protein n=1 Tax=Parafrankia sp. FMc2 TaxID=3233196 RepID=UPI0034D74944